VRDSETDSTSPVLRVCVVHSMLKCETLNVSYHIAQQPCRGWERALAPMAVCYAVLYCTALSVLISINTFPCVFLCVVCRVL
jgi:hypothetical protein